MATGFKSTSEMPPSRYSPGAAMTGRTALKRSLVPDGDASTCLAGCPHGSNPTNTVVAALAADHYGRAIHKDELCAPRILHFPHQGLGAGNGTFCDHVTGFRRNGEPVIHLIDVFSVDDDNAIAADLVHWPLP